MNDHARVDLLWNLVVILPIYVVAGLTLVGVIVLAVRLARRKP